MNKLNTANVVSEFENSVNEFLAYYQRSAQAFHGSSIEKSDNSFLNEQALLYAAIVFEGTLLDLYFAYINKSSSVFFAEKERKIKVAVETQFGSWYSSRVSIPHHSMLTQPICTH